MTLKVIALIKQNIQNCYSITLNYLNEYQLTWLHLGIERTPGLYLAYSWGGGSDNDTNSVEIFYMKL